MNTYNIEFFAKCPSNGIRIKYTLTITTPQVVMVEDVLEAVEENTTSPVYHEKLADNLSALLPGLHEMVAFHHGVEITTVRGSYTA